MGVEDGSPILGLTGGLFLSYACNDRFAIQPELLFTEKGTKTVLYENLVPLPEESTVKLGYLEFGMMLKWYIDESLPRRLSVYAGPVFSWKRSEDIVPLTEDEPGIEEASLGVATGGGMNFEWLGGEVMVDVRYATDLTELLQEARDSSVRNHGVSLSLGYSFLNPSTRREQAIESGTLDFKLRALPDGTRTRVVVAGGSRTEGTFAGATADSLAINTNDGVSNISLGTIEKVSRWDSDKSKPTMIGFIAGIVSGGAFAAANNDDELVALVPIYTTLIGTTFGFLIGMLPRWIGMYP